MSSDSIVSEGSETRIPSVHIFEVKGGDIETINVEFERLKTAMNSCGVLSLISIC